jgi:hypothetical protein
MTQNDALLIARLASALQRDKNELGIVLQVAGFAPDSPAFEILTRLTERIREIQLICERVLEIEDLE